MARGLDRLNSTDRRGRRQRQNGEKGAAVIETAFTLTLLVMLLLGITTAGIAYGQSNALQTAAREGARFGATLPDVTSKYGEVRAVTEAAATGVLDESAAGHVICVALVDSDPHPDQCFGDGRPDGEERVQVVVERPATINAVVFSTDITLRAEAAARYER